jgi:hypothetical protein
MCDTIGRCMIDGLHCNKKDKRYMSDRIGRCMIDGLHCTLMHILIT